jgi:protein SCO1
MMQETQNRNGAAVLKRGGGSRAAVMTAAFLLLGTRGAPAGAEEAAPHDHTMHQSMEAAAPLSSASVYNLDGEWTDHNGKKLTLQHFAGRPLLLTMIFTRCQYACPILVENVKGILARLPEARRQQFNSVFVSFDVEKDDPETLKAYAAEKELASDRWTLLHGSEGQVLEVAAALGVRYRKDASSGFAHSNLITLLDEKGEIAFQLKGLDTDATPIMQAIDKLFPAVEHHSH